MNAQSSAGPGSGVARWIASSVPAAGAVFCVLYTLMPDRFHVDARRWIAFAAVAEIPVLFLGAVHAIALKEGKRGERYFVFGIGLLALGLMGGLNILWAMAASEMAPMFVWLFLGMLVELYANPQDPQLAHDRAWALLDDRARLLGYIPNLVVGAVVLGIVVQLAFFLSGAPGFEAWLSGQLREVEGSDFALLPAGYLAVASVCTAHAYGPAFLHDRRGLLAVLEARWLPSWWPRKRQ